MARQTLAKYLVTIEVESDEELSGHQLDKLAGDCVRPIDLHSFVMNYVPKGVAKDWGGRIEVSVDHAS